MQIHVSRAAFLLGCLLSLGSTATAQDATKEKALKHDLEKLQGEWRLVRCETDGARLDIGVAKLLIKKTSYVLRIGPGTDKGTFALDPLAKPKSWDSQSEGSNETLSSIYELNGNRLRFAYRFDDKRPASLFGKLGSEEGHVLYVFERGDGRPERIDKQPKKNFPKVVVPAGKKPFRKEIKLAQGDVRIVVLPNGKEVMLWANGNAKSGLDCRWESEPYIEQGAVIYSDKTTEHELFVGDWKLSYVHDPVPSPQLKVTVIVTKREKKEDAPVVPLPLGGIAPARKVDTGPKR